MLQKELIESRTATEIEAERAPSAAQEAHEARAARAESSVEPLDISGCECPRAAAASR